ncbi:cytochrome P450, partial [Actinoplanes sp. NPDC051633]|uniref:cytochrome P450 n=1 Tax=Actinoplanes sp. NPDC051633 TaxID=3155670 RepID=UPI00341D68CD
MKGRARDRLVYLRSHPVLFALLAATRRWPVLRLGRTLLIHDRAAYEAALTGLELDRTAAGTTGGAVAGLAGDGLLFDQHGAEHRRTRRSTADLLGAGALVRLGPLWTDMLSGRLAPLAAGHEVDLVPLAADLAGATAAALLANGSDAGKPPRRRDLEARELAVAALAAAAAAARVHLPGPTRIRTGRAAEEAAGRLTRLIAPDGGERAGLDTMLAVAAINTTVAALPRAAAWAADDALWDHAPEALADELLRVVAPTPLLPRVAAQDGEVGGCPVRSGDRLLLIARHAVNAHRDDP